VTAPRIIITRPEGQGDALAQHLRAIGYEPVAVPAIAIEPPASFDALDRAIQDLPRFDWALFTSRNGVEALLNRRAAVAPAVPLPRRLAAIGPGTAEALAARGYAGAWVPSRFLSAAVADEMPAEAGQRVLRVRAEAASELPTRGLRARGVEVVDVVAYRTVEGPPASRARLDQALRQGAEAVVFTSASTVRGVLKLAAETGWTAALPRLLLVAIGPVTARALKQAGLRAGIVARSHAAEGIVAALAERRGMHAGFPSE
jgi:uroporphyrinogen-III synthase